MVTRGDDMAKRKVIVLTVTLDDQDKATVDGMATDLMLHMQTYVDREWAAAGATVYMGLEDELE